MVQLTTLHAEALYPAECTQILNNTHALADFTGLLCYVDTDGGTVVESVSHLKSLILGLDGHHGHSKVPWLAQQRVLDTLTAPAPTHLTISERFFGYDALPSVTAFLARSQCPLTSFHVAEACTSADGYRAIFPSVAITVGSDD
jgi:hypothetical protein